MESPSLPPSELAGLSDKYTRMRGLRLAQLEDNDPGTAGGAPLHSSDRREVTEPDPRVALARLAADFPGALREIDTLPLTVIEARIEALAAAARGEAPVERWMEAQALFHRLARGALVAKRWLAGHKRIEACTRRAFLAAALGSDAELFASDLARIANPPGGRLMRLVHERVADALGIDERAARSLVFERPR